MGSSSSVLHTNNTSVYPNLDINGVTNSNMPFSSFNPAVTRNSLNINAISTSFRNASPIDNVPFSLTNVTSASTCGPDDDIEVAEILNRIHHFVNNSNLSEYNFKLENSILRESF